MRIFSEQNFLGWEGDFAVVVRSGCDAVTHMKDVIILCVVAESRMRNGPLIQKLTVPCFMNRNSGV